MDDLFWWCFEHDSLPITINGETNYCDVDYSGEECDIALATRPQRIE